MTNTIGLPRREPAIRSRFENFTRVADLTPAGLEHVLDLAEQMKHEPLAWPTAIFLHCLPAKRGEEVAADVIDGYESAVWRQAANRLPTEEALLLTLTRGPDPDEAW
jgi:ornithine carbamoyltransferase